MLVDTSQDSLNNGCKFLDPNTSVLVQEVIVRVSSLKQTIFFTQLISKLK
jgi:hypothetical protein